MGEDNEEKLEVRNFFFILRSINLVSVPRMVVKSEDASSDEFPESLISPSEAETDAAENVVFTSPIADVAGTVGLGFLRCSASWVAVNVKGDPVRLCSWEERELRETNLVFVACGEREDVCE